MVRIIFNYLGQFNVEISNKRNMRYRHKILVGRPTASDMRRGGSQPSSFYILSLNNF